KICQVNGKFRTGIKIDDYYKILGNTKISLAPIGTTIDTFRYIESFGSGCIVITTKKDNIWYYENAPCVFINDWNELNEKMIDNILNNNLDYIYEKNLAYYKDKLSEESVANYIIKKINNLI